MIRKKIVFLTGTRADFGKLKSLISIVQNSKEYEVHLFVTGMHLNSLYGLTIDEVRKAKFDNIYPFINHDSSDNMDRTLARTIDGFSHYVAEVKPDLIVVHGDRVEALAGAIVGSLNNVLVAHIEGGEVSGTIDELIRHAVSKMSHIHLVANQKARSRLVQLGELPNLIFIIGSPDIDLMRNENLPHLSNVKKYYDIEFEDFSIALLHPVTTEVDKAKEAAREFVTALIESDENYVVIYPNNDLGSHEIINEYKRLENNKKIRIYPSLRFEFFLVLMKYSGFMVGNSSAGIREAAFYNTPTVNIGSRQNNRSHGESIFHCSNNSESILKAISQAKNHTSEVASKSFDYGQGNSAECFLQILDSEEIWDLDCQKQFQDITYE